MIKKVFIIIIPIFITIFLLTITNLDKENILRTNYELESITGIENTRVYLLDNNNYFVEVDIFENSKNINNKVKNIINYLKIDNENIKNNFNGYINSNAKLNNIEIVDKTLYIDFSKEILTCISKIDGLLKSLLELEEIEKISITVDNNKIKGYEEELDKIILNKENKFTNRNNIKKVEVVYYEKIDDKLYKVPVTKYLNSDKDKIEIIIDELKDNIPNNLISFVNGNIELINSSEENNNLILELSNTSKLDNETYEEITSSIFRNYEIDSILIKENNKINNIINKPHK